MKFRKKPVEIEAFQYDGDLMNQFGEWYVPDWAVNAFKNSILYYDQLSSEEPPIELYIKTLEGDEFDGEYFEYRKEKYAETDR